MKPNVRSFRPYPARSARGSRTCLWIHLWSATSRGRSRPPVGRVIDLGCPHGDRWPDELEPLEHHTDVFGERQPHRRALTVEEARVCFQPPGPRSVTLDLAPREAVVDRRVRSGLGGHPPCRPQKRVAHRHDERIADRSSSRRSRRPQVRGRPGPHRARRCPGRDGISGPARRARPYSAGYDEDRN